MANNAPAAAAAAGAATNSHSTNNADMSTLANVHPTAAKQENHSKKRKHSALAAEQTTKIKKKKPKQTSLFSQFAFGPAAFQPLDTGDSCASAALSSEVILDVGGGRQYIVDVKARTQTNCATGFVRPCQRIAAGVWAWRDGAGWHAYIPTHTAALEKLFIELGCPNVPLQPTQISNLLLQSVPKIAKMRGQRNAVPVINMIITIYRHGLFTMGKANSSVNREVVPAIRKIFEIVGPLPATHPKRVNALDTLAQACLDCQQVQAREILRIYGDLTNKNRTLEKQLLFFLTRQKEHALHAHITATHANCDLDHTQVEPGQQRAHLYSAYLRMLGNGYGMLGFQAAVADRFIDDAAQELERKRMTPSKVKSILSSELDVGALCQEVLADINNQEKSAERLIEPKLVWDFAQKNFTVDKALMVAYDEERAADYEGQVPDRPTEENKYEVFLSTKILVEILETMRFIVRKR